MRLPSRNALWHNGSGDLNFARPEPFYRELFTLAIPIGLQSLLIALIGATDALMLGRFSQDIPTRLNRPRYGDGKTPESKNSSIAEPAGSPPCNPPPWNQTRSGNGLAALFGR